MKIELLYDRDCLMCNKYANFVKLKKEHELILLNAREHKSIVEEFRNEGYDVNKGNIIRVENKELYQGIDAMIFLNDLAEKRMCCMDSYFFRKLIYPIMMCFRKLTLVLTRKYTKI